MDIDISKDWVGFVKKLNDIQNQSEVHYLKVMIKYFSDILKCENGYLIKVEQDKLNWSSYASYGNQQFFLDKGLSNCHQEMLVKPEIKRKKPLLILPVVINEVLVMILGFHNMEKLSDKVCEQIMAMAEVGYQRIEKNKMIFQLKKSERIFRMTFEQAGSGMCQSDLDGIIRFANSKFYNMIGYTSEEARGLSVVDLTYEEDLKLDAYNKQALRNKEIPFYSMEKRYVKKNGSLTWVYVTVSLMEGEDLEEDFLIGVIQDINGQKKSEALQKNQERALEKLVKERTHALVDMNKALIQAHKTKDSVILELKETKVALEEMAVTDPLTHVYNRRYMMEQLEKESERYRRYKTPFALIIGDIDYFKDVNDSFGHGCGDAVLLDISQVLLDSLRKIDILCRWGGEEFLILLPETNLQAAAFVAERMRREIEAKKHYCNQEEILITMTFGVTSNLNYESIEALIKGADDALFVGKDKGRNIVVKG